MTKAQKIFRKYALLDVRKLTSAASKALKPIGGKLQNLSSGKATNIAISPPRMKAPKQVNHNVLGSGGKRPLG